jgi:hypothetical protein
MGVGSWQNSVTTSIPPHCLVVVQGHSNKVITCFSHVYFQSASSVGRVLTRLPTPPPSTQHQHRLCSQLPHRFHPSLLPRFPCISAIISESIATKTCLYRRYATDQTLIKTPFSSSAIATIGRSKFARHNSRNTPTTHCLPQFELCLTTLLHPLTSHESQ